MAKINRRRSLPPIPSDTSPQTRQYLSSLQEMIETGEGTRGDPLDTKLTFRDLIDSGIAKLKGQIGLGGVTGNQLEPGGVPDMSIPPAPQGAEFVAVFDAVTAVWSDPYAAYSNHAYTEIWRADGENASFSDASMIGVSDGSMYSDYTVEGGENYTYWIRFASTADVRGPWHKPGGTSIQALVSVERMLEELSGNIDESVLSDSFKDRLNGFQESISEQGDLYTLTLNNNGYISGFGTYNDGTISDFAVVADRFWIAPPNSTGKVKPFIVSGGSVYIDSAFIRDASIQEGKLGPISFGKIKDSYGQPVTTLSGKLKAQNIDVDSLRVTNANISGDLWSTNYSPGVAGWKIWRNGNAEFNSAEFRGKINFADLEVDGRPVSERQPFSGSFAYKASSSSGSLSGPGSNAGQSAWDVLHESSMYVHSGTDTANARIDLRSDINVSVSWHRELFDQTNGDGTYFYIGHTGFASKIEFAVQIYENGAWINVASSEHQISGDYYSEQSGSISYTVSISGTGTVHVGSSSTYAKVRVVARTKSTSTIVKGYHPGSTTNSGTTTIVSSGGASGSIYFYRF